VTIGAIEIADKFPNLSVVGNDLSPIQPTWIPSNVRFVIDDIEKPWLHKTPFDFVFGRYLLGSIQGWPALVRSAYELSSTPILKYRCLRNADQPNIWQEHQTRRLDRTAGL
jgi:hypothetical protein